MQSFIFNPFNAPRQEWRPYHPDSNDPLDITYGDMCMMLNRKTGMVYLKPFEKVMVAEMCLCVGHDMMIAYLKRNECFDPMTGKGI